MDSTSQSNQPLRPILPKPSGAYAPNRPRPAGPRVVEPLSQQIRKRQNIAAACDACRERKSRCDGVRPTCTSCVKRRTTCVYRTTTLDETHSQALKRKFNETEQRKDAYQELFHLLRAKSELESIDIWNRIRNGMDVEAILRHVKDGDLLLQLHLLPDHQMQYTLPYIPSMPAFLESRTNEYLRSWLFKSATLSGGGSPMAVEDGIVDDRDSYLIPYHAAEIIDSRISSIKAADWTTVIKDDNLLHGLLQTYFLLEYPFFPFFHKDYFLEDMAANRRRFCSPLLVHAILAAACHGYSKIANRFEYWNPQTLGYQLLSEARRLWELEAGNTTITTVQAGAILALTHNMNGTDKIGWAYSTQTITAAQVLGIFKRSATKKSKRLQNVHAITAWGLYGWQAFCCFHLFKSPLLHEPLDALLPDPSTNSAWYGELWVRYPRSEKLLPISLGHTFKASAEFRVIMNDIAYHSFSEPKRTPPLSLEQAFDYQRQLEWWFESLPGCLTARQAVLPCQLKVHMHYYNILISIFQPFLDITGSVVTTTIVETPVDPDPRQILKDAKIKLETVLRLYYLRHGFELYDVFIAHFLSYIGFIHIKELPVTEVDDTLQARRSTIILTAKGLRDQSRNYYLAEVIFRMMKDGMGKEGQLLLRDILNLEDGDEERKTLLKHYVKSEFPVNIVGIAEDPEKQRLEKLINTTAGLELETEPETPDSSTPEHA